MLFEAMASGSRRIPAFRGKANVARRVMRWRRAPTGEAWLMKRHSGDHLVLPADSEMCWEIAFTGLWDDALIAHMSRYLRPGTVVLDIGAAVGLWTIPLAHAARIAGAKVVAIEPLPGNARWLNANLALNGLLDDVIVHHVALGSSTGMARIESAEMAGGNAALALGNGAPLAEDGIEVPLQRLDDLELPGPVGFLKMDVEGFECEVLRGACALVERDRPVIFGEFDPTFLNLRHEKIDPLARSLLDLRYRIFAVDVTHTRPWKARDRVTLRPLEPPLSQLLHGNLLLLPDSAD